MESHIEKLFKSLVEVGLFEPINEGVYLINGYEVLVSPLPVPSLVIFSDYELGTMEARVFGFGHIEDFGLGITEEEIQKTLSVFSEVMEFLPQHNRSQGGKVHKQQYVRKSGTWTRVIAPAPEPRPKTLDSWLPFINKEM
jgi:hypothetical protein